MRFLGLGLGDQVPDRTTIWLFRETLTKAGAIDALFERFEAALKDRGYFAFAVWADTADRSAANETALRKAGRRSMIHSKRPKGRPMPGPHQRANGARSKVRAAIEHIFGEQTARMQLTIRTIGLARAKTKIGLVNLADNMRRLVWLDAKTVPA